MGFGVATAAITPGTGPERTNMPEPRWHSIHLGCFALRLARRRKRATALLYVITRR